MPSYEEQSSIMTIEKYASPSLFGVLMTKGGLFGNNQVDQLQKMIIEIIDMDP